MKRGIAGLTYVGALLLAGFFLMPSVLSAQDAPETFTATATVTYAGKSATEPVKIVINRFLTDAERMSVLEALKAGGTMAAKQALDKMESIGVIELLGRSTPIKFAFPRSMGPGGGRIITVVTAEPVHYLKAGQTGEKPKADYPVAVALLILDSENKGDGEIAPAAKLKLDASNAVVIDDYGVAKVWLKDVAKAK
jgi:hypothetical protein